jgi:DNA replication protein DnaC
MSEYLLTPDEEAAIISQAEYHKADHENWKRRAAGLPGLSSMSLALTDTERSKALDVANNSKRFRQITETMAIESRRKAQAEEERLKSEWGYEAFLKLMRTNSALCGTKLVENEDTLPLIKAICFRLSGNARYETELGLSFNKGLIIHGEPGLGKSYLWELVKDNPICPVQVVTMHDIVRDVVETGDYKGLKFATYKLIYIDDVGTEYFGDNAIKRYGTDINWFKTFIEEYYAKFKPHFNRIVISTNDSAADLGKKYGFRVRDRLAEMFNVLPVKGKNFRR